MNGFGIIWGKGDAAREEEEVVELEMYRERLREIEVAFHYNLSLLSERDNELDVLEEQLRSGIAQVERLSHEKTVYEDFAKKMVEEKNREIQNLTDKLMSSEKKIRELERRNDGSTIRLRKKLEDVKKELSEERTMHDKEKARIEKNFIRAIQLKEAENMEMVNQLERKCKQQVDQIEKQRHGFDVVRAENKKLRNYLLALQKEKETKEKSYLEEIKQLNSLLRQTMETMKDKAKVGTNKPAAETNERTKTTQTIARDEVDRKEFLLIREQNNVLKSIIKNLKNKEKEDPFPCQGCLVQRDNIRVMKNEVDNLREALHKEKSQRLEEEALIQNLESSVVCLKEKLLTGLRRFRKPEPDI